MNEGDEPGAGAQDTDELGGEAKSREDGAQAADVAPSREAALVARIESLERSVAAFERRLDELSTRTASERSSGRASAQPIPPAFRGSGASPAGSGFGLPPGERGPALRLPSLHFPSDPGQWVNRLGIALLLLGAAFGFKYSIDRGWLGPVLRVIFGGALGAALLFASTRLRTARPGLSHVLAGGGIAAWYLTIFAACQLYFLVSPGFALLLMTLVTAKAFQVALRDDDAMTALVGTIGGLATPFLLYTSTRSASVVVVYACVVVAASDAVFLKGGWRSLLWTTTVGGWLVLASAAWQVATTGGSGLVVQLGVVYHAFATWWLSMLREMLSVEDPERWPPTTLGFGEGVEKLWGAMRPAWPLQSHQLALATPILVLALTSWIWTLGETASGYVALTLAAGWGLAAVRLRGIAAETTQRLAVTHALAAAVMIAFAIFLLLGEDARLVGLAIEAVAMLHLGARSGDRQATLFGHLLLGFSAWHSFWHIVAGIDDAQRFVLGGAQLAELTVIAALAAASQVAPPFARAAYLAAAEAGLLLWIVRVLVPLPGSAALITAFWFANAVLLLVLGLRFDRAALRSAGAAVMTLTMAKLFAYDLAAVDPAWRIVSFLAFGLILLALGYAFPTLWRRREA